MFKKEREGSSRGHFTGQVWLLPLLPAPLFTKMKHSCSAVFVCRALVCLRNTLCASSSAVAHSSEWRTLPTVIMLILCAEPSLCTHLCSPYEALDCSHISVFLLLLISTKHGRCQGVNTFKIEVLILA